MALGVCEPADLSAEQEWDATCSSYPTTHSVTSLFGAIRIGFAWFPVAGTRCSSMDCGKVIALSWTMLVLCYERARSGLWYLVHDRH